MTIKMLIDATHEEETRVAIVHGNRVEEFDYESSAKKQIKGNIYLAKITRVEPSLQAAFVDYGGNRHGFLAFSEIHPDYYQIPVSDRETLIAEEKAAYSALLEDEEEVVEKKPKRRPRRKPKPKTEKTDEKENDTNTPVATLEGEQTPETESTEAATTVDTPKPDTGSESDSASEDSTPDVLAEAIPLDNVTTEDVADEDTDGPSITKAENVGDSESVTEEVSPEDLKEDAAENSSDDSEEEDDRETVGSNDIDDEEAEEKLRIKIAKGLRRKYKIQEVIKKNQIILIQVVKEERGNKGAALTTYLSLPGRYCVLMPNTLHGGGVSRKIANVSERKSLKKIIADLDMPSGIACIIRTAGQSRTKTEIKRDFDYLIRTWEGIRERTLKSVAPVMINEEGDLIKRSIRDLYTREVDEILVEGEKGYKTARNFMKLLMPSHARKIKHYAEPIPLLHKFQVESQLDSMYSPIVQLRSGGYIVINPTEALVSIDVNSGKATKEHNIEETARKTNLEAAEEVARQLRLRDMAGLVVIDFIDMENRGNNRAVEQKMKESLKTDRARIQVGRISSFGLMEMSRQRLRAGVLESSTRSCPHCEGSGVIRSVETQVLHILRALEEEGIKGRNKKALVLLPEQTAIYLLNNKRAKLVSLEEQYSFSIEIAIDTSLTESAYKMEFPNGDSGQNKPNQSKNTSSDQRPNNRDRNRDRTANNRPNRQRNQNRKNRNNDVVEPSEKAPEQKETLDKTLETQDSTSTDQAENKTRRRRRRPRRNNRDQSDEVSTTENTETTPTSEPSESNSSPVDAPASEKSAEAPMVKSDEKPKRRRSPRKKPTTSSDQSSSETTQGADSVKKAETQEEKKPARRPYPPQARSRRKPADSSNKPAEKDSNSKAKPKAEASPKEPAKAVEKKQEEPKSSGPKKSGWWQRTFG